MPLSPIHADLARRLRSMCDKELVQIPIDLRQTEFILAKVRLQNVLGYVDELIYLQETMRRERVRPNGL